MMPHKPWPVDSCTARSTPLSFGICLHGAAHTPICCGLCTLAQLSDKEAAGRASAAECARRLTFMHATNDDCAPLAGTRHGEMLHAPHSKCVQWSLGNQLPDLHQRCRSYAATGCTRQRLLIRFKVKSTVAVNPTHHSLLQRNATTKVVVYGTPFLMQCTELLGNTAAETDTAAVATVPRALRHCMAATAWCHQQTSADGQLLQPFCSTQCAGCTWRREIAATPPAMQRPKLQQQPLQHKHTTALAKALSLSKHSKLR